MNVRWKTPVSFERDGMLAASVECVELLDAFNTGVGERNTIKIGLLLKAHSCILQGFLYLIAWLYEKYMQGFNYCIGRKQELVERVMISTTGFISGDSQ